MDYYNAMRIIKGSKRYEFEDMTVLIITDYYTGERVALDLSKLTEEMLEELAPEENDEEDEYYE